MSTDTETAIQYLKRYSKYIAPYANALVCPSKVARAMLSATDKHSPLGILWVCGLVPLFVLFALPVYSDAGVDWRAPGFYLPIIAITCLFIVVSLALVHLNLRLKGINSSFWNTAIIVSVAIAPILWLSYLPMHFTDQGESARFLVESKAENLSYEEANEAAAMRRAHDPNVPMTGRVLAGYASLLFVLLTLCARLTVATDLLVSHYNAERHRVIACLGGSLFLVLLGLFVVFSYGAPIEYSFTGRAKLP